MSSTIAQTIASQLRGGASVLGPRLRRLLESELAVSGALFLGAIFLYGGAVKNGFTFWDDDIYVTRNPLIEELSARSIAKVFTSFSNCNYHPLTYLSYMLDHALAGLSPWLYHLTNVLLHAAASVLAYHLGRRWLNSRPMAFLAATLFLVHPLRVESVAWVAERKDVLCAVFYLAALLVYPDSRSDSRGKLRYAAALGLFLLALLSKVMAVSLPAVLVLLHWVRKEPLRPRLVSLLPFFALATIFAALGVVAQSADGAISGLHGGSLLHHLLSVPKALAFYAEKLVMPLWLSPRYMLSPASGLRDLQALAGIALLLGGAGLALAARRRRPAVLLGLGFFLVTWAPVSGVVPSSTLVADRYLYLPALGLFWSLAVLLVEGARRGVREEAPRRAQAARAGLLVLGLFIAACSWLTVERVKLWGSSELLWKDALAENPRNSFAHNQLSITCAVEGRYKEAIEHTVRAAELGLMAPKFLFNLCRAYRGLGDNVKEIESARELVKGAPDFLPAWLVVARHLVRSGDLDASEDLLDRLEERFAADAALLAVRGDLEAARGRPQEALLLYLRSLKLDTFDPEVFIKTAETLAQLGDGERALKAIERALSRPGGVWYPDVSQRLEKVLAALEAAGRGEWTTRARELRVAAEAKRGQRS